jgi:hypothetical protein
MLLLSFVVILLVGTTSVQADYVGSYLNNSAATATKNFFGSDFSGTTPSVIPSGDWIASVMSNTGELTTGPWCPCLYQIAYIIDNTGNVAVLVQYYGWSYGLIYGQQINAVGTASSIYLGGLTRSVLGGIQSVGFVYNTATQISNNSPTIYTFSTVALDQNFWYGTTTAPSCGGATLHYYQAGVESPTTVKSSSWKVDQYNLEAYNVGSSSWVYAAGKSIGGLHSYFQCMNGVLHNVSGNDMPGVNTASSSSDSVSWHYTGTTIGNDVTLWTGSGGFTPYPCQVYSC